MSYLPPIVQLLLFLVVIPAALFDLKERRVPNWITFPGVLIAVALNSFLYETPGLWLALKGLGLAMLIYVSLYLLHGMGAGDVKLMAAIGAAAGWANWIGILFLTAIFGGISALILVLARGRLRRTLTNISFIFHSLSHRQLPHLADPSLDVKRNQALRLPHAVAIAFGTLAYLVTAAIWAPR